MQKIDNIEIQNFKSIRDAKISDCKRVNIFIGYPNVGKSNILEAIGLLAFIHQKRPDLLKGLVRFEKLTQLFNYFNIQNPAIIKFNENYYLKIDYVGEDAIKINLSDKRQKNSSYDLSVFGLTIGDGRLGSSLTNGVDDFSGRSEELQKFKVKPYKFTESKIFNENYSALELKIPFGKNLFEVIANNFEIRNEFTELLKPYGLELVIDGSNGEIKISPPAKNGVIQPIPISLMADTLIRLIFFKTAIFSNKESVLLFEEPESHMFPPYITKFTNDIIFNKNNNQYFIATHSPYVLNEFMDNLKGDELAIYIVTYKKETMETKIHRMGEDDMHEAYQFGYDFFMNIDKFISQE